MQETYTFSRALHLMRYGGKKMRPITWSSECAVIVDKYGDLVRTCPDYTVMFSITSVEIMGSWVEVKDDTP